MSDVRELAFATAASLAALGAAALTRKLVSALYERAADEAPPRNPAADDTDWSHALLWAAISGATAGLAKATARRGAAAAWTAVTDDDAAPIPAR